MRLCAVSVDLDEIPNYHALHGLAAPADPSRNLVYEVALQRLVDFAHADALPLTLFAIASDLERHENAVRLRQLADAGHEIANHSLDHRYDLTRLPRAEMLRQVQAAALRIAGAVGRTPRGFRAPGYTVSDELFDVLRESDVHYDSSVFPCPSYYAAKAATRVWIQMQGRESRSVLDTPSVLRAPTRPYRVGRPYFRRGEGILELPIQVTRGLRLPYIGTTLTLAGPDWARRLTSMVVGEPLVNLELHGIDLLDVDDGLEALRPHQPDVRVSVNRKMDALSAAVERLREAGYGFVRLEEVRA